TVRSVVRRRGEAQTATTRERRIGNGARELKGKRSNEVARKRERERAGHDLVQSIEGVTGKATWLRRGRARAAGCNLQLGRPTSFEVLVDLPLTVLAETLAKTIEVGLHRIEHRGAARRDFRRKLAPPGEEPVPGGGWIADGIV